MEELCFFLHFYAAFSASDLNFPFAFGYTEHLLASTATKISMGFSVAPTAFYKVNFAGIDRKLPISFSTVFGKHAKIAPKKKEVGEHIKERNSGDGRQKKQNKR